MARGVCGLPRQEATLEGYARLLDTYVRPNLDEVMLHRRPPVQIQDLIALFQEKKLSRRTIKYMHSVLRSALQPAMRWDLIVRNPADAVNSPKQEKPEVQAMDDEQAQRFLAAAESDECHALFALMLSPGLRPSEALALPWRDLDLATGEMQVRRTLIRPKGGGWRFADTKNSSSRRRLTVPGGALQVLREHRDRAFPSEHGLIFCNIDGEPLHHGNVARRSYKRVLDRAGLEGFRFYDLRHTCATLLLLAGTHPKVVAERLGHSSIRQTLDTHSHVIPSMQQAAAGAPDDLLFQDREEPRAAISAPNNPFAHYWHTRGGARLWRGA